MHDQVNQSGFFILKTETKDSNWFVLLGRIEVCAVPYRYISFELSINDSKALLLYAEFFSYEFKIDLKLGLRRQQLGFAGKGSAKLDQSSRVPPRERGRRLADGRAILLRASCPSRRRTADGSRIEGTSSSRFE